MLLVVVVLPLIIIAVLCVLPFAPFAFAVLQSSLEFSNKDACVFPFVLAKAVRFTVLVLSIVNIPIRKQISSLTMF